MVRTKKEKVEAKTKEPKPEQIEAVEYSDIMKKSYIDYSMSVIVDRALPDARDGFKPVQRRILYDMKELGATSDKPHRKTARIVGDTMGKYHPHGDSSIEGALVVMAQDFKQGTVLIDGHGNFGSIEGDGAAAMRYTEARLSKFAEDVYLSELDNDTVAFRPNYDETLKEPTVLPAKLPNFFVNGCEGIAVGMATSVPPHNIGEVVDATTYYLNHPNASTEKLLTYLHGPDFPTGGIICNESELKEIYETGIGKVRLRGKVQVENGKKNKRLVITEIPYTMIGDGINNFLVSVADLVKSKTLPEITDISNQSSKEGIRIVLDLSKDADAEYVKNVLYKKTSLEENFSVNMLAVWNNKPCIMSLRDILQCYADFQYEIYEKKFRKLLEKALRQKEIDEGLITAVNCIDAIVAVLRGSKNTRQAKLCLTTGDISGITFKTLSYKKQASKFSFTENQAQAILEMKLQRLIGLELDSLQKEYNGVLAKIQRYEKALASKSGLKAEILKDLNAIKANYSVPRKTKVCDIAQVVLKTPEVKESECYVVCNEYGYIHAIAPSVFASNQETIFKDYKFVVKTTTMGKLALFSNLGVIYSVDVKKIPLGTYKSKGIPVDNISNLDIFTESIVALLSYEQKASFLFITAEEKVKRTKVDEFAQNRKEMKCIRLTKGDSLAKVEILHDTDKYAVINDKKVGTKKIPLLDKSKGGEKIEKA